MVHTVTEPVPLTRPVPVDFLAAVQGIAALERRVIDLRSYPGDFRPEVDAANRLLLALRDAFGIREMSEDEIDAAHEAAVASFDALVAADGRPDVPTALDVYWNGSR